MTSFLVHWIWQGVVLVAVVSLCLVRARHVSASMRCRLWWATLVLVAALPFPSALGLPGAGALLGAVTIAQPVNVPGASMPAVDNTATWLTSFPLIAFGAWVAWHIGRFCRALAHLDGAKRVCRPFPIVRERALPRWRAARNRGRRATLVISNHVRTAAVLGLGYPRIAVAPELVSSLTDHELDQLVLHEYAHVQRRDDVASAIQVLVKALLGWHPAMWWIDRRLRIEREVACDDWVLAMTGEARTYARCLTRIADLAGGNESSLMPTATRTLQLTTRIMRLLDARRNTSIRPSGAALAAAALVLAALSIGLAGNHTTIMVLPVVSRAGVTPAIDTPELAFTRLAQVMSEPVQRASQTMRDNPVIRTIFDQAESAGDAVHAATVQSPGVHSDEAVADAGSAHDAQREQSAAGGEIAMLAADAETASAPAVGDPPVAGRPDNGGDDESNSWVDSTRRAIAEAGKSTGQSIAEASVSTGFAVADASVAAARSTQKSAAKAGRFFSRLGRKLARPF